jgi:hypothetical protein
MFYPSLREPTKRTKWTFLVKGKMIEEEKNFCSQVARILKSYYFNSPLEMLLAGHEK